MTLNEIHMNTAFPLQAQSILSRARARTQAENGNLNEVKSPMSEFGVARKTINQGGNSLRGGS